MRAAGRPDREFRSAWRERNPVSPPGRIGRAGARGFTLAEALIALSLLALLSLLGYRATSSLLTAQAQVVAATDHWGGLERLFARLEADLRSAVPRAGRIAGETVAAFVLTPDADGGITLAFARAGSEFGDDPLSAGQRIAYRWRRGVEGGQLQLLYWPALDNLRPEPADAVTVTDALAELHVRLLTEAGDWVERWPQPNQAAVPKAVSVGLRTRNGEWVDRLFVLR